MDDVADYLTSPAFLKTHPSLPSPENPLNQQFQGDASVSQYAQDAGDAYEGSLRRRGASDEEAKKHRATFEPFARQRAKEYALQTMSQSEKAQSGATVGEYFQHLPIAGHFSGMPSHMVEAMQNGQGTWEHYYRAAEGLAKERDEANRGYGAGILHTALGIGQLGAEMALTGGAGGSLAGGLAERGALAAAGRAGATGGALTAIGGTAKVLGYGAGATAAMPQRIAGPVSQGEPLSHSLLNNYIDNTIFPALGVFGKQTGNYGVRLLKSTLLGLGAGEASQDIKAVAGTSPQAGALYRSVFAKNAEDRLKALRELSQEAVAFGIVGAVTDKIHNEGHVAEALAAGEKAQEATNANVQAPANAPSAAPAAPGPAPEATAAAPAPNGIPAQGAAPGGPALPEQPAQAQGAPPFLGTRKKARPQNAQPVEPPQSIPGAEGGASGPVTEPQAGPAIGAAAEPNAAGPQGLPAGEPGILGRQNAKGWITPKGEHLSAAGEQHLDVLANSGFKGKWPQALQEGYARLEPGPEGLYVEAAPQHLDRVKRWVNKNIDPQEFKHVDYTLFGENGTRREIREPFEPPAAPQPAAGEPGVLAGKAWNQYLTEARTSDPAKIEEAYQKYQDAIKPLGMEPTKAQQAVHASNMPSPKIIGTVSKAKEPTLPPIPAIDSFHIHPAQAKVPALARGWRAGEDAHFETYPEPRVKQPEGETVDLPPDVDPRAKPLIEDAWDKVSGLWPEMAANVKKISVFDTGGKNYRAAVNDKGELRIPIKGGKVTPETLWHEMVHLEQQSQGRFKPQGQRTDAEHIEMEREAYSRAAQMRPRFAEMEKGPTPEMLAKIRAERPQAPEPEMDPRLRDLQQSKEFKALSEPEQERVFREVQDSLGLGTYNPADYQQEGPTRARQQGMQVSAQRRALGPLAYAEAQARGVQVPPPTETAAKPTYLGQQKAKIGKTLSEAAAQIAELKQQTFPRTTRLSRPAGEALARNIAVEDAIPLATKQIQDAVLGKDITEEKARLWGAAYVEERLRHMHDAVTKAGQEHEAATVVGQDNSPLKTEEEFQKVLADPEYQAAVGPNSKWTEHMLPEMNRNLRESEGMEEDDPIKSLTQIPGREMNLKFVREGEETDKPVQSGPRSGLANIRGQKLGFSKRASGQSNYDIDLRNIIANSVAKGRRAATKNVALRTLEAEGLGVKGPPGTQIDFGGEKGTEIKGVFPQGHYYDADNEQVRRAKSSTSLVVHPDIYDEVKRAFNVEQQPTKIPVVSQLAHVATWTGLQGLAEGMSHTANMFRSQFAKGMRPWEFFTEGAKYFRDDPETQKRLLNLTEIGSGGRTGHGDIGAGAFVGKWLNFQDKVTRLQMDKAFDRMVEKGMPGFENTETNRRDFINQYTGQYNRLAQHFLVRTARDTGLGPFATAGMTQYMRTMATLAGSTGLRGAPASARVGQIAKTIAVPLAAAALWNYFQTGRVDGDDQTPIGAMYLGKGSDGATRYWDPLQATGVRRGLRSVGLTPYVERLHGAVGGKTPEEKPGETAARAAEGMAHAAMHPFLGPLPGAAQTLVTGKNAIGIPLVPEHLKPGQERLVENAKAAAAQLNPAVASFTGKDRPFYAQKEPRTWEQFGYKQLQPFGFGERKPKKGRFSLGLKP